MQTGTVSREEAEKVFIVVENNQSAVLEPGYVCEWSPTTTAADQGRLVELVDAAVNLTTGIAGKVAGVVDSTINTAQIGRLQVYGPKDVVTQTTVAVSRMVVASSVNATNIGMGAAASQSTAVGPEYAGAIVGWSLEGGTAALCNVQLCCM